jgi:hypothetical protein
MRQFSIGHLAAPATLMLTGGLATIAPRRYPGRWVRWASWVLGGAILAGWAGDLRRRDRSRHSETPVQPSASGERRRIARRDACFGGPTRMFATSRRCLAARLPMNGSRQRVAVAAAIARSAGVCSDGAFRGDRQHAYASGRLGSVLPARTGSARHRSRALVIEVLCGGGRESAVRLPAVRPPTGSAEVRSYGEGRSRGNRCSRGRRFSDLRDRCHPGRRTRTNS